MLVSPECLGSARFPFPSILKKKSLAKTTAKIRVSSVGLSNNSESSPRHHSRLSSASDHSFSSQSDHDSSQAEPGSHGNGPARHDQFARPWPSRRLIVTTRCAQLQCTCPSRLVSRRLRLRGRTASQTQLRSLEK